MSSEHPRTWNRRQLLGQVLGRGALAASGLLLPRALRAAEQEGALEALPGKRPLLRRTYRPPNYETPLQALGGEFTPNDAFFVRYHLAPIPEAVPAEFHLTVSGDGAAAPLRLGLDELARGFEQVEVAALCHCAGNRRGWFEPRVPGVQWGPGAMGNARFRGVRLRDVLRRAGLRPGALEVLAGGADRPVLGGTPDFVKSLPLDKALDPDTLLAFEMNGAPLPLKNGAPLRLVVPGWAATYWMKHLDELQVLTAPATSFWMRTGYRIPRGVFPVKEGFPGQSTEVNTPITELVVNSLVTSVADGAEVPAGRPLELRGVAWDGGGGVREVEVSTDGGKSFRRARLGPDHGRYAWRTFTHRVTPTAKGPLSIVYRARSRRGEEQPAAPRPSPAGYHHNAVGRLTLRVVALLLVLLAPQVARAGEAGEARLRLKDGPGRDLVTGSCAPCHSLDYLQMNGTFLDRKGWEAVVNKMINVMGAPIEKGSVPTILDYLARAYGKDSEKSR